MGIVRVTGSALSRFTTSGPIRSGMWTSRTIREGGRSRAIRRASAPQAPSMTSYPARSRVRRKARRVPSVSSTTAMVSAFTGDAL